MVRGSSVVRGRIIDLAIGGLGVLVDPCAIVDVGAYVRLDVRLDGLGRWLHLTGFILRVDARPAGAAVAIEWNAVPQDFEDLVQEELLSELECVRVPQVLLVDGAHERRALVAAAFRATGCRVIVVSSPLEAIVAIDQSRLHLRAVVIADTLPASHADELRRFLGEMYPDVPLLEVGERVTARTRIELDDPALAWQIDHLERAPAQLDGLV